MTVTNFTKKKENNSRPGTGSHAQQKRHGSQVSAKRSLRSQPLQGFKYTTTLL